MSTIQIKDSNGKEFSVDLAKIQDINGDMGNGINTNISDSIMKNRVAKVHDIEYIDEQGKVIDSMQLLKDMQDGKIKVYALDVEMEATHSGRNHNYCIYKERSMENDSNSFLNPFNKPMLKNHNDYNGEPLGRIKQSYFGPSNITDERSAIFLKARVTDADAIPKFLDGRYATVSIGGSMGTVTCGICGKTILKDGKFKFCGHWRGETYKDQICYWDVEDIEYNEVSVVNNPADDFAQITKVTVITDSKKEEDNKQKGDNEMGDQINKDATTTDAVSVQSSDVADNNVEVRAKLLDAIDSILGTVKVQDQQQENAPAINAQAQEHEAVKDSDQSEKTVEDMQKEIDELNAKVNDLTSQLTEANQKVIDAEAKEQQAVADAQVMKDQFIELAKANKEMVIDHILEISKVEDANMEERKAELSTKSMKELSKELEDAKKTAVQKPAQRIQASTENPTLANTNEGHAEIVNDSNGDHINETPKDNKNNKQTVDDYANDIIRKLCK